MAKSKEGQNSKVKKPKSQAKTKRHFSSGGAVFRQNGGQREWLIIKPAGSLRWQLPKGTIDPGEKSAETAIREIFEETGVHAKVLEKIDTVRYFFNLDKERIFKSVVFYLMESEDNTEAVVDAKWAHEIAEAVWVPEDKALEMLSFKSEKQLLEKGIKSLDLLK